MNINREELAWAAGLFDGEGHVRSGINNQHRRYIRLTVGQISERVMLLERFRAAVFVGNIGKQGKAKGNRKLLCSFHVDSFEKVQAIIAFLWKFLSLPKKRQAKKALVTYHNNITDGASK